MADQLTLSGLYFAKGISLARPAVLTLEDVRAVEAEVSLTDEITFEAEITAISDRIGTVDRQIRFRDGGLFVTSDNDGADRLRAIRGGMFSRVARFEVFHPRLAVYALLTIALLAGLFVYGIPAAARLAAWVTPQSVAVWMDDSSRRTLDRLFFDESVISEDRQAVLQAGFSRLVAASGENARFELIIRDGGSIGANALALPGGTVVLTDQFVELVTDDEAIAVMAHEIAHVEHRHSLRQAYNAMGVAAIIAVLIGDIGAAEEVLGGGGILLALSASRAMELEADAGGVDLLRKVGVDPANLSSALDKLYDAVCADSSSGREACEESSFLSTHPGGAERREALQRHINER